MSARRLGAAALAASAALAAAGCGADMPARDAAAPSSPRAAAGVEAPFLAAAAPSARVRIEVAAPAGMAPADGARLALMTARLLGPEPAPGARPARRLRAEAALSRAAGVARLDWVVRDEGGATIGAFSAAVPGDAAAHAPRLAAASAARIRRLPPVRAAIEGAPGF
ncbi:hypothetical protein [Oceanicella actignis]|uniref:hypothetical protein n=1 Tax=Oceanicella actignis TaxID=1189325 RepID=UPI0011E62F99|nr:hypothetical protein [Oceanicella actignis]TYO85456.1 hypothetical protein LY05_02567 [Oceanicella actignis]